MRCDRHPDRRAVALCQKYTVLLCSECLACRSPDLYCSYRSGCLVHWEEEGQGGPHARANPVPAGH